MAKSTAMSPTSPMTSFCSSRIRGTAGSMEIRRSNSPASTCRRRRNSNASPSGRAKDQMVATPLHGWSTTILVARRRQPADERRVVVSLTPKGESLRKRMQQMLGEFYCFLNLPLDELFDLKDRLRRLVQTAGPKEP